MKLLSTLAIGITCCIACNNSSKTEVTTDKDTTVVKTDTVALENDPIPVAATTAIYDSTRDDGELIEEKGETVYVSRKQYSFISDPYDFYLSASTIEGLLGEEAKTKVVEFEAGEDYSAYSYTTITFKDTEISFYDYAGKHFSTITTNLLPLKNGIKIGMKKDAFRSAMGFSDANASNATVYRLVDDYGQMDFSFQADSLYHICAHYEEGD